MAHKISEKGRNAERADELVMVIAGAPESITPSNLQPPCEACHGAQDRQLTRVWFFSLPTSFNLSNSYIFLVSKQNTFHTVKWFSK